MSAYDAQTSTRSTLGTPSRPRTLTATVFAAVLVGLLNIVSGIVVIAMGRTWLEDKPEEFLTTDAELAVYREAKDTPLIQGLLDDAFGIMQSRAVIGIVIGVLVLGFALLARNAATWARVLLLISVVAGLLIGMVQLADIVPDISFALLLAGFLLGIAVIVMVFLPANNRHRKALSA